MCLDPSYIEALLQVAVLMALPFALIFSAYLVEVIVNRFFPGLEERIRRAFGEDQKGD
jgi:hypothetical protein